MVTVFNSFYRSLWAPCSICRCMGRLEDVGESEKKAIKKILLVAGFDSRIILVVLCTLLVGRLGEEDG